MSNESLFPEAPAHSRMMNQAILAGVSQGETTGTLGRAGETTPTNPAARETLSAALNDLEAAERSGDKDAIHFAEFRLERARGAARAAREQSSDDRARDPETGQFIEQPGFDGGVRGRRPLAPGGRLETASQLMQRAFTQSRAERLANGGLAPDVVAANY